MDCQDIRERLPALIDKELDPAEMAAVEKHLAECPECRKEKNRQEKFTTSVKVSLEGLKPSDRFIKRVIDKLPDGAQPESQAAAAAARRRSSVSLVVAVIVIVLALIALAVHAARRRSAAQDSAPSAPPAPAPAEPGEAGGR